MSGEAAPGSVLPAELQDDIVVVSVVAVLADDRVEPGAADPVRAARLREGGVPRQTAIGRIFQRRREAARIGDRSVADDGALTAAGEGVQRVAVGVVEVTRCVFAELLVVTVRLALPAEMLIGTEPMGMPHSLVVVPPGYRPNGSFSV